MDDVSASRDPTKANLYDYAWVIVVWDLFVMVPMVLLWYFGFLSLDGDFVPYTGPGPRRYRRIRLTAEELELRTRPRQPRHEGPLDDEEQTIDHEFFVMAREWEDDLREARRLARQERIRRLNSRLRNGVAGVRSSFASMGRIGSQREGTGSRESGLSSGAGRIDDNGGSALETVTATATINGRLPATPPSTHSSRRSQQPGSQSPHALGRRDRAWSDGYQHQRAVELQSPRRSRLMTFDLNRPLPALPTTRE